MIKGIGLGEFSLGEVIEVVTILLLLIPGGEAEVGLRPVDEAEGGGGALDEGQFLLEVLEELPLQILRMVDSFDALLSEGMEIGFLLRPMLRVAPGDAPMPGVEILLSLIRLRRRVIPQRGEELDPLGIGVDAGALGQDLALLHALLIDYF